MKTYIIQAHYCAKLTDGFDLEYWGKHYFKCDLDLSNIEETHAKIKSRLAKLTSNFHGCKISFSKQRGFDPIRIIDVTEDTLKHFAPGDAISLDSDNDEVISVKTLLCNIYQLTSRSKQYRRISLHTTSFDEHGYEKRKGMEFNSPEDFYYDLLDKDGIFIKTITEEEWKVA